METAVVVIWWVVLILALALTVIILPVIFHVVHALREIDRLAKVALPSAVGIVENTATIAALDDVLAQARRLLRGVQLIGDVANGIEQKVTAVGAALAGKDA